MSYPDLSRLARVCPTGADAPEEPVPAQARALATPDIVNAILSHLGDGNFSLACRAAARWCDGTSHEMRGFCNDEGAWATLLASVFPDALPRGVGQSNKSWFFELCNRHREVLVADAARHEAQREVDRARERHERAWHEMDHLQHDILWRNTGRPEAEARLYHPERSTDQMRADLEIARGPYEEAETQLDAAIQRLNAANARYELMKYRANGIGPNVLPNAPNVFDGVDDEPEDE